VGAGAVAVAGAGLVALVGRRAGEGRAAARAARTDIVLGARVAVVAGRAVRLGGVGAGAAGVAGAGRVALVVRRAGGGGAGRASAGAVLARLPARAGVVVVAGGPVRDRRVLTSRDRVARVGGARVAVVARRRVRQRVRDHELGLRAAAVGVLPVAQGKLFLGSV